VSELFDEQALLDTVDGDIEFLEETVGMLDEDAPTLLDEVRRAAEERNAEGLARSAHALKSMLGNFCAAPAQEAARRVEEMGRHNQLTGVDEAVQALRNEAEQLKDALKSFLQARKS
jgi:HPt (histidine-containing phosphotransfer) domain-containing protein